METSKLDVLLNTVKVGSINRAAEKLGYTQSGLTYVLNSLEEDIGVQLIKRTHKGIELTTEGARLMPFIEQILNAEQALDKEVSHILSDSDSVIRIGTYSSLLIEWLSDILKQFKDKYPSTAFEIRTGAASLTSLLDQGVIDIALCEEQIAGTHHWEYIASDEMCAAIHESNPLSRKESIRFEDLIEQHIIFPSVITRNTVSQALDLYGLSFNDQTQIFTEDGSATLSLVSRTHGISFVAGMYAPECPLDVALIPLDPPVKRRIGVAYSASAADSQTVEKFVSCLRKNPFEY